MKLDCMRSDLSTWPNRALKASAVPNLEKGVGKAQADLWHER